MRFTKMHGAGNDFVVLDAVEQPLGIAPEDLPGLVSRLCDRHTGVGADGVMVEVHNDPQHALCDGQQSITPDTFAQVMADIRTIAGAVGREI